MPCTSRAKKVSKPSQEDGISALPDGVLQHVLGFLGADEAVYTSLLARRWRYLWKSMRHLRINFVGRSNEDFLNRFVNCLLLCREPGSILDEFEFNYFDLDGDSQHIGTWIRHALSLQAQVIGVKYLRRFVGLCCHYLDTPRLVSRYLRRLEISEVELRSNFLDFSSCSVLEDLKIEDCILETSTILSQSLKHLSMLSLETAVLKLLPDSKDLCGEGYAGQCCGCCGNDAHEGCCVLVGGLSHAKNLELLAYPGMFFFRRDLRWCPTFSKLKTLLLNEWCVQPDLHALVCMLEHSPVLENLTLQLRKQKEKEEPAPALKMEENRSLMEKPAAISGYLKIIKVNFEELDGRVLQSFEVLEYIWRRNYYPKDWFYC